MIYLFFFIVLAYFYDLFLMFSLFLFLFLSVPLSLFLLPSLNYTYLRVLFVTFSLYGSFVAYIGHSV
jgi:hypothetical protein